eukprot:CAMPEP_0174923116 /NCGR_PEP_ID=MMETSP1355-20121228/6363_1 /TAXON_ID=464990 /ORGANISM="Hemiselmis tepida, Strain CCMP443" /LENGTH=401 /DNA_ID=CAMNT_0016168771 /DNA_START=1 /DNA_END=1203 /DNA_ORIENTATION=-
MLQMRKEMRILQMDNKRLAEEMQHKLSVVDSRLQAGESSYRILEKREASAEGSTQQLRQESEIRMTEVGQDVGRLRRQVEAELRQLSETSKAEMKQRDAQLQQLDAVARSTILELRAVEDRAVALEQELKAGVERRLGIMGEGIAKAELTQLERIMAVERLLEKEAGQRTKGDVEVRQELEDILQAVKATAKAEAGERSTMHRELRGEVMDLSKLVIEQVKVMRDEQEHLRGELRDGLAEERSVRDAANDATNRKLESFSRLYDAERERVHKSVREALSSMFERTAAVQELIKGVQKDGEEVKRIAAQVQEDAGSGLKNLAEKLEDGLRGLRSAQERASQVSQDAKLALASDQRDLRERVVQTELRLRADAERAAGHEREDRRSVQARLKEVEELARGVDR